MILIHSNKMNNQIPEDLFTLEMANNHMGDVQHGIKIIKVFGDICKKYPFQFSFKFQYRALDTFIHPSMVDRDDIRYVKRFSETELSKDDFNRLLDEVRHQGFLTMSTPFDQESVDLIEEQNLDIIKIASCSFTDWPLLERVAQNDKPIIASTAGASTNDIDQVISFLTHRDKEFAIMHCVGQYPTPDENIHLGQLKFFQDRYPGVRFGFSTHEDPGATAIIQMAVAVGATIFEKHVAVPTEKYGINNYSSTPEQLDNWLNAAQHAKKVYGMSNERLLINPDEKKSLRSLQRGAYARTNIMKGKFIELEDVFFAFPPEEGQFTANDWSKYFHYTATEDISKDEAIHPNNSDQQDTRDKVWEIVKKVRKFLKESQVVIPGGAELEISHHYGLEKFDEYGLMMITVVNRDYCKKILVTLPGQSHPEQLHKKKEETFHVLYGELHLQLDGELNVCKPGDVITVLSGVKHSFSSENGSIMEEISSTHYQDDSYYTDPEIMKNKQRKTLLRHWME